MIRIIPAIDIIDGHVVRLTHGRFEEKTIYNKDPLKVAKWYQDSGFKYLHLVDLDGAKAGKIINWHILEKIANGKLNKFYQESVLTEQVYIKDNTKTVGNLIKDFNTKHNSEVNISLFHRFHLGDEKK